MLNLIIMRGRYQSSCAEFSAAVSAYFTYRLALGSRFFVVCVVAFYSDCVCAGEQGLSLEPVQQSPAGVVTFLIENDTFGDKERDSQYTNGFLINYASFNGLEDWQRAVFEYLPLFSDRALSHTRVQVEYSVGQQIFTPDDLTRSIPDALDRPYAGWLYVGTKYLNLTEPLGRRRSLASWEFNIGIVGPGSGARQVQTRFHSMFNGYEPDGWDYQLENELGVLVAYQKKWLYLISVDDAPLEIDLSPNIGTSLGNVYTYLETGLMLRVGRGLRSDYGPMSMRPSAPTAGNYTFSDAINWYVYIGVEGRAVAQNIFLDGNTFSESPSVKKEVFVGDVNTGVVFTLNAYRLLISHTRRSREFKFQNDSAYSAVALSIGF